jgi:hypothetical protein
MEGPLSRLLISSRSVNIHGRHRRFLFLIGRFFLIFSSKTSLPNEPKLCYCFLPSLNINQVPEKDILVRNQIQMYNKIYPVNTIWLLEQNKCRIKKTLTGQRRNTMILKHLVSIFPQTEHKYDLSRISWSDSSMAVTLIGFICKVNLIYSR